MNGLSPRWRGNRLLIIANFSIGRSIPALAGQPRTISSRLPLGRVYPRAGGATSAGLGVGCAVTGLSPRWRGNPWIT